MGPHHTFPFLNILIYSKVGGFAEIIRNFYNVKQFYGCTLSLFWTFHFIQKFAEAQFTAERWWISLDRWKEMLILGSPISIWWRTRTASWTSLAPWTSKEFWRLWKRRSWSRRVVTCRHGSLLNHYLRPWSKCSRPLTFSRRLPTATLHYALCHVDRHFGSL